MLPLRERRGQPAIIGWAIGAEGSLTPVGDREGVPATVAGLAAS
jgi:hypothetical protein